MEEEVDCEELICQQESLPPEADAARDFLSDEEVLEMMP